MYNRAFDKFTNFIKELSEQGQDVQVLAQKIYKNFMSKKAKVKYSMGPSGSVLPDPHFTKKLIDKILGNTFFLLDRLITVCFGNLNISNNGKTFRVIGAKRITVNQVISPLNYH